MRVMWLLMAVVSCGLAAAGELTLVRDGQAASAVVLQSKPTPAAELAAARLVAALEKMSGAKLPVVRAPQAVPAGALRIELRSGAVNGKATGEPPTMAPEELRVQARPGALVLSGCDAGAGWQDLSGTFWAALQLLEYLGCRWLWPGDLGEVVPQRRTVSVPDDLDLHFVPPLVQRHIRMLKWNERQQPGLEKLGLTREGYEAFLASGQDWWLNNRDGKQGVMNYGHAFGDYWERFGKDHPDWFALQPGGSRDQGKKGPERARLCVSNPGLQKQVAADAIAQLKANPALYCASISPNDGGPQKFCTCPACEAWDAKDGPVIDIPGMTPDGKHVSLTDRYVKFYNAVADLVARELPDRKLGAYAYSAYSLPPLHVTLRPNVIIGYVGFTYLNDAQRQAAQETWAAWGKAAPGGLFLRPNLFMTGMGFPVFYPHRLGEDLKRCAETGMKVTDFDTCFNHWALSGLNYYVTARLLWDPSQSVDGILDDYCRSGFGPAAGPVRQYFDRVEKLCDDLAAGNQYQGYKATQPLLARQFGDAVLAELNGYLDEAKKLAAGDERVGQRVAFLRIGIDYARVNRDVVLAKEARDKGEGDKAALGAAYEAAMAKKLDYLKSLGYNWGVNGAYLLFYGV